MNLPKPLPEKHQRLRLRSFRLGLFTAPLALPLALGGGARPLGIGFLLLGSLLFGLHPGNASDAQGEMVREQRFHHPEQQQQQQQQQLFAQARRPGTGKQRTTTQSPRRGGSSSSSGIKPVGSRRPADTPPDLLLQKAGEKMADALSAFAEGLAAEEEGDFERALEAYHRSLAFDPANVELAVKVAFELAYRGDVPQGIDILKDAEKAAPKDYLPPLCLSQLFGKYLKKNDLAEKYALRALALEPGKFPPYLALFEIYTTTKQGKKAEAIIAKAAKAASPDPMFWLQVAEVYSRLALKNDEVVEPQLLPKITGALEKAYETAIAHPEGEEGQNEPKEDKEATTTTEETLIKIADFYVLLRQLKPAIPIFEKVVAESTRPNSPEMLALREKLARCLLSEGDREKAIAMLEEILKQAPSRYDLYEFLGELYSLGGEMGKAIRSYQKALLIDGTQPNNFLRIADLQLKNEQPEKAVKTLREASRRFRRHPHITFSLALALREAQKYSESLIYFAEAEELTKGHNSGELNGFFYFAYGVAAEQAGQTERAAELLAKSIRLDPSNAANAYNYLGYMWAEKGERLDEALQLINQALAMEPENPAFIDSLGWCYYQLGRYEEALVHLQKAADTLEPADSVVFEHLGDVQSALGNTAAAEEAWERAIATEPKNAVLMQRIRKKIAAGGANPATPAKAESKPEVRTVSHEEPQAPSEEAKPTEKPTEKPLVPASLAPTPSAPSAGPSPAQ